MRRAALPALVALLAAVPLAPALAPVEPPLAMPVAKLPYPAFAQAAVWTGKEVLVLGGADLGCYCELDGIVRHDPATGGLAVLAARLPEGAAWASAVWDGRRAHVFHGRDIHHVDPASGEVTTTRSPRAVFWTPEAFFDGRHAYVFQHYGRPVLRYDPVADLYEELPVRQPRESSWSAVASDGRVAYLFGGGDVNAQSDRIWRFDPAGPAFELLDARLPLPAERGGAAWDPATGTALLVGGHSSAAGAAGVAVVGTGERRDVLRFDPAARTVAPVGLLPFGMYDLPVVATPAGVFTYGGSCLCAPTWLPTFSGDPLAAPGEAHGVVFESDLVLRMPS